MENKRFDTIARGLATGASRRRLLGGLFGATAVALGGTVLGDGVAEAVKGGNGKGKAKGKGKGNGKGQPKTSFCHQTGNGSFTFITVSQSSRPAHLGHGDVECPPDPCKTYTETCNSARLGFCDFTPVVGGTCV